MRSPTNGLQSPDVLRPRLENGWSTGWQVGAWLCPSVVQGRKGALGEGCLDSAHLMWLRGAGAGTWRGQEAGRALPALMSQTHGSSQPVSRELQPTMYVCVGWVGSRPLGSMTETLGGGDGVPADQNSPTGPMEPQAARAWVFSAGCQ